MACDKCGNPSSRKHNPGCPLIGGSGGECTSSSGSNVPEDIHTRTRRHHCMRDGGHGRPGAEDTSKSHRCTCGYEWS